MNAPFRIATEYVPTTYRAGSYTMNFDDFSEIIGTKTDALSGRTWAFGRNSHGMMISAPLGVPLCIGCDRPIVDHLCPDCEQIFVDEAA